MKDKIMGLVIIALIIEVTAIIIISILAMLGAISFEGCYYRYPLDGTSKGDSMATTVVVKANGNYTTSMAMVNGQNVQTPIAQTFADGSTGYIYGQWLNTGITLQNNVAMNAKVSGAVSLCRAYLPANNLESDNSNANYSVANNPHVIPGQPIPIPRVEETISPIQLLFDARSNGWRNLTKVGLHDEIQVTIGNNPVQAVQGGVTLNNLSAMPFSSIFSGVLSADCSDNRTTYGNTSTGIHNGAICNRYTPYNIPGQQYITACNVSLVSQLLYYKGCYGSVCNDCGWVTDTNQCCNGWAGSCWDSWCSDLSNTGCHVDAHNIDTNYWQATTTPLPKPYTSAGTYTYPATMANGTSIPFSYGNAGYLSNSSTTTINGSNGTPYFSSNACSSANSGINATTYYPNTTAGTWPNTVYLNQQYFWFTSDYNIGLYQRINSTSDITGGLGAVSSGSVSSSSHTSTNLGASPSSVTLITGQAVSNLVTYLTSAVQAQTGYLQYRFMTAPGSPNGSSFSNNSGGYTIGLKQTACRAINATPIASNTPTGSIPASTDPLIFSSASSIGDLRYLILPSGSDPNNPADASYAPSALAASIVSSTSTLTPSLPSGQTSGTLWLKIGNDPRNYADSFGQYSVQISTVIAVGQFSSLVLDKLLGNFKSMITSIGIQMFANMTCMTPDQAKPGSYVQLANKSNCSNFFTYIQAMLTLYVTIYGLMFLLGMVKISNQDLVIRVVKIALVAGLLNGQTLQFFNTYVFSMATGFTDQMIANLSGYSVNTTSTTVSNPFMFLDNLMSRIFFSKTFFAQVLSILSLGVIGCFYFIIIFIALVILIITVFRAIGVYIMSFMAIALLLGIAPLFLTFLLFEKTYYLFENWLRFLFRYMMEPVILMAGITVLTQLFTIYLDYVLGHSVCWKCALVFQVPFIGLPGLELFQGLPLFCLNWFGPWGLDNTDSTGMIGMNLQNMIALMMIAYAMYGYTDISGSLVGRLTNTMTAPSMTAAGKGMVGAAGQKILKQVGMDSESRDNRESKNMQAAGERRQEVKKLLDEQKEWKTKPLGSGQESSKIGKLGANQNPQHPNNPGAVNPQGPTKDGNPSFKPASPNPGVPTNKGFAPQAAPGSPNPVTSKGFDSNSGTPPPSPASPAGGAPDNGSTGASSSSPTSAVPRPDLGSASSTPSSPSIGPAGGAPDGGSPSSSASAVSPAGGAPDGGTQAFASSSSAAAEPRPDIGGDASPSSPIAANPAAGAPGDGGTAAFASSAPAPSASGLGTCSDGSNSAPPATDPKAGTSGTDAAAPADDKPQTGVTSKTPRPGGPQTGAGEGGSDAT